MIIASVDIPHDHGYLVPIGDLHRGDKHLSKRGLAKLQGYMQWILDRPNAYTFLMGDILNVASRGSKTNPFESMSGNDEYAASVELFRPLAKAGKIIGCCTGNHEQRMYKDYGFNPLQPFCNELGIKYCGFSSCIKIRVGKKRRNSSFNQTYWGFAHHGNGGGSLGASMNRKVKLQEIVHGMDFYMAGHDHQLMVGTRNILLPYRDTIRHQRVHYIDTGSFLDYDGSYAEEAAMPISKQGAPRIRFEGREDSGGAQGGHHDVHVSI